jgi:uncharacterized membrane protein (UPF0136 family)
MKLSFLDQTPSYIIALSIFVLMLLFYYAGMKFGIYRTRNSDQNKPEEVGATEGALIGLLALLMAFTFGAASDRFVKRNNIIVNEANAIGTAALRADLYGDSIRREFRKDFKNYVEARIDFFEAGMDMKKILLALGKTETINMQIWNRAALLAKEKENFVSSQQMIPALNAMIDIVTERNAAGKAKVPELILWVLFSLCLIINFIMGYSLRSKTDWVVVTGFSLITSLAIFLILDLDRPRQGIINANTAHQEIVALRKMFND